MCAVLLWSLYSDSPQKALYLKTTVLTLLTWSNNLYALPRAAFSEEVCEAHLSKLGAACLRHPQLITVDEVMDLYLVERMTTAGGREHVGGAPPVTLVRRALTNLDFMLQQSDRNVITFVPWKSGKTTVSAVEKWDVSYKFPVRFVCPLHADLTDCIKYFLDWIPETKGDSV